VTAQLLVGDLDLMDPSGPYTIKALGTDSGTTFGSPEAIVGRLRSLLQYGSIAYHEGVENRLPAVAVIVGGPDAGAVAEAEAALMAELYRPNTLTHTAADGYGAATVFDVYTSSLEPVPDDLLETVRSEVVYMIRFECAPYVHSEGITETPALAASGTTTTSVDAMSAATNWTAAANGAAVTPVSAGGALTATSASLDATVAVTLTRTATIDTSATKYLVIDWKVGAGVNLLSFTATADNVALTKVASGPSPTAGYTRTTFYVAAASVAAVTFTATTNSPHPGFRPTVARSLTLDQLSRSDVRPTLGSAKQQIRTIDVGGSAPTTGSLSVEHATSALGDVIVYTYPDDDGQYAPPCRNYRVPGGPTPSADAAAISGYVDIIDTASVFDVPVAATPDGEYLVVPRIGRHDGFEGTHTVNWSWAAYLNGVAIPNSGGDIAAYTALFGDLDFHRFGVVHLPLIDTAPHGTAVTRFSFVSANPGSDNIYFDDLLLFNMTTGRLTQVSCGTAAPSAGGASNRLWIESPSLANGGLGRYLRGYADDQSDAFSAYPTMETPGVHEFEPPRIKVYTVTTNPTTAADVAFAHRHAWHSRAAD
jgi:hypothetical protein